MSKARPQFAPIDFRDRFPALDGIRALAVTMVFLDHFGGGSHGGRVLRTLNQVRGYGWTGVDIFLVLSGFLITGILYDTQKDSRFFQRFFVRRSLRIFPVFYLVVTVILILTPILHYQLRAGHLLFLVYMGNFLGNHDFSYYTIVSATHHPAADAFIGHFWSLSVEEQFYLLWPMAVYFIRDRIKLIRTAVVLALLALLLRYAMVLAAGPKIAETWTVRTLPFRMDALLIGGTLALLLRGPNAARWQKLCTPLFAAGMVCVIVMFSLIQVYDSVWLLTFGLSLTALTAAGLIGMTLPSGSASFRLFYKKPLRILGKYSYGFYLYHVLFGNAWVAFLVFLMKHMSIAKAGIISLGLNFTLTFLVAKLSYDFFEVKFLRWKTHFEYDKELTAHKHAFTTK